MERRSFLKLLGLAGGAAYPVLSSIKPPVTITLPQSPLPKAGDTLTFIEDVYYEPKLGSPLQSRALPLNSGSRLIEKRWDGKRWVEVRVLMDTTRRHGYV